ncbi:MAG: response regulator [Alkalispirochaeta sp.]
MSSILVVEDDPTSRAIVERVLQNQGYHVEAFESPVRALSHLKTTRYDVIISDYFMPGMNGDQLLHEVRAQDRDTPFLFLTANTDVKLAVELVKAGADDHILKPIVGEQLLFRVEKTLEAKQRERLVRRVEQERELLELERKQLTNWRLLYAAKDITQTEQMINLLSRTINQAGGFLWVDLLRSVVDEAGAAEGGSAAGGSAAAGSAAAGADGTVAVDRELLEMVITAGAGQKEIFDYVTFIAGLESMPLETSSISISDLVGEVETQAATLLGEDSQERSLHVMRSSEEPVGSITGDQEYLSQAIHELLVNAMKYSPPKGRIVIGFCRNRDSQDYLDLTVSNTARPAQAMDRDGEPVFGIPYDFSELVFDLFYTIDAFQTEHPRERWGYGTGLYVVRKLIKRHGGWITAGNGVDYTGGVPETIVRVTMTLPIAKEG